MVKMRMVTLEPGLEKLQGKYQSPKMGGRGKGGLKPRRPYRC